MVSRRQRGLRLRRFRQHRLIRRRHANRLALLLEDWETADLWGIAEDSGWYELIGDAATARGMSVEEAPDHDGVAPYLQLPPTWEGYLEALPSKLRHEIRGRLAR